ncbi:MAG: lipoyl synthase [Polyangiales bacterium]
MTSPTKKPEWLRVRLPNGDGQKEFNALKDRFREMQLHTVCEEARCPNIFECWSQGTATIMILGGTCTRGCRFCSVQKGHPGGTVDHAEPKNTAIALSKMGLAYVVMTMVDRDDLHDGGAAHVSETIHEIRALNPTLRIETLVGDFQGVQRDVATLVQTGAPDVFAHNVEVVPRLQRKIRDVRCSWERSEQVLRWAKELGAAVTKSSLMVGISETDDEVFDALDRLKNANVDVVTIGQYLRPTKKHANVERYVSPDTFERYREHAESLGFLFVASGPLVRSSYRAAEAFLSERLAATTPVSSPMDRYGRKTHLRVISSS